MKAAIPLLALFALSPMLQAAESGQRVAITYSSASVVNAASNVAVLAPNTIASIYGEGLSWKERSISEDDIRSGNMPTILSQTGVRVIVNNIPACIYYVSPGQINFLVPANLLPGPATVRVTLDGAVGPKAEVELLPAAPAFFQLDAETIVATHADEAAVTAENPARPGEIVVLYLTGLGRTKPWFRSGEIVTQAAWIEDRSKLTLLIDGEPVERSRIEYAGVTPGSAGLYQINVKLPDSIRENPEIRVLMDEQASQEGLRLPANPNPAPPEPE